MGLKKLIISIEKRPQMYINNINIHTLSVFISGYLFGKGDLSNMDEAFQRDFSTWVTNYYGASIQNSWSDTIYYYEGNHNKSVECFFDLYKRWYESEESDRV